MLLPEQIKRELDAEEPFEIVGDSEWEQDPSPVIRREEPMTFPVLLPALEFYGAFEPKMEPELTSPLNVKREIKVEPEPKRNKQPEPLKMELPEPERNIKYEPKNQVDPRSEAEPLAFTDSQGYKYFLCCGTELVETIGVDKDFLLKCRFGLACGGFACYRRGEITAVGTHCHKPGEDARAVTIMDSEEIRQLYNEMMKIPLPPDPQPEKKTRRRGKKPWTKPKKSKSK